MEGIYNLTLGEIIEVKEKTTFYVVYIIVLPLVCLSVHTVNEQEYNFVKLELSRLENELLPTFLIVFGLNCMPTFCNGRKGKSRFLSVEYFPVDLLA